MNLDSDGIIRVYHAGESANHRQRLDEVFGDSDWGAQLAGIRQQAQGTRQIMSLYKAKLRALPNVRYVFAFEMRSKKNAIDYHLVFASQHPTGLEKMKEVMKRIDQDGSYCYSDESIGQQTLFRFDDPATHAQQMFAHFRNRTLTYDAVNECALNESPFPNPKAMLTVLEAAKEITGTCSRTRRKGTFPDEAHSGMQIRFQNSGRSCQNNRASNGRK